MNENPTQPAATVFGHPRDYLDKRFVYAVISQRAGGLSIGVNLTPDRQCNFDCIYCEVNHQRPVVIQGLFPEIEGIEPPVAEIEEYVQRLRELKQGGRANFAGANLFRPPPAAPAQLRPPAAAGLERHRPPRAPHRRPAGGGVLT
jgi:hypothetical protein